MSANNIFFFKYQRLKVFYIRIRNLFEIGPRDWVIYIWGEQIQLLAKLYWPQFCLFNLDVEDPVILSCPANQTMNTVSSQSTAIAVWTDLKATDNSGIAPSINCSFESGSQFEIGQTEVICEARDPSGNHEICTFIIEVTGK